MHATGFVEAGITLGTGAAIVEGNAITGAQVGIVVSQGGSSTIRGNQLEELGVAIGFLGTAADAVIEGNRFCGNERNLGLPDGSSPALDPSNEVCDEGAAE